MGPVRTPDIPTGPWPDNIPKGLPDDIDGRGRIRHGVKLAVDGTGPERYRLCR